MSYQFCLLHRGDAGPASDDWLVRTDSGLQVDWNDFHTGPIVLDRRELDAMISELPQDESIVLAPSTREDVPFVILHSATRTTGGFEGDITEQSNGRHAYDCATYLETRAVNLARPGDLIVGRTRPWAEAAAPYVQCQVLNIGFTDYYYLCDALLVAARSFENGTTGPIEDLICFLRKNPTAIVNLYSLDAEMSLFLRWLARKANLDTIHVGANGEEVGRNWNRKAILHPTIADASALRISSHEPFDILRAESELAPLGALVGQDVPFLPGYVIERAGQDSADFAEELLTAAALLTRRYEITTGCLKPSNAGDGARIVTGVDLTDPDVLRRLGTQAHFHGDDYVLEAHINFASSNVRDLQVPLAPSAHIKDGQPLLGATLQTFEGFAWTGNIFFDESSCESLGLRIDWFDRIATCMDAISSGFGRLVRSRGAEHSLVKGGVDFSIGSIGGLFGSRPFLSISDPNLSSHGAEFLYEFKRKFLKFRCGTTRIARPSIHADFAAIQSAVNHSPFRETCRFLASVPGRWGMIAAAADDPSDSIARVLEFEKFLLHNNLLTNLNNDSVRHRSGRSSDERGYKKCESQHSNRKQPNERTRGGPAIDRDPELNGSSQHDSKQS